MKRRRSRRPPRQTKRQLERGEHVSYGFFHFSVTPLILAVLAFFDKDVVGHGVPGIVDANEEQQQDRSSNAKHRRARM